jgi:hypothetical protein
VTPEVVLAVHDKLTSWTGAGAPVPVTVAVLGELEAVLANVTEAEAVPVAPGVNFTVNTRGWFVVTVTGNDRPLTENSEGLVPPKLTEETETLTPVAVSVPV